MPLERRQGGVSRNGPRVADPCHSLHHLVIAGGDDDGRARLLEGAHGETDILELKMLAVKGDGLLGPEALHDIEGLEKPGQPPAAWNAERIELHVAIAEADPEDEAAATDHVERRNRLGDVDGLLQGQQHDARPERHLAGFGRHARQHRRGCMY